MVFPFLLLNQLPEWVGVRLTLVDDGDGDGWGKGSSDLASISRWDVCFIVRLCK